MRIMIDTNVLISIFLFPSARMLSLIDAITERHTIILPSYVLDELKNVIKRKFPQKYGLLDQFIQEFPFALAYTPEESMRKSTRKYGIKRIYLSL